MSEVCPICADDLTNKYTHTLDCNHTFHYECLFYSFKKGKNLLCPLCRSNHNKLPIVNGIKQPDLNIHIKNENYKNILCNSILKTGKNKGNLCNNKCMIGYYQCKRHLKT
jgi:hypothetical protein